MNILITGTAGYVGGMLADQYAGCDDINTVVCVDKEPCPEWLQEKPGLVWIQAHLSKDDWEEHVRQFDVQVVIHAAWQIRDWYGGRQTVREWNIESSRRVFNFALNERGAERMVYFSSIAQYGACSTNTLKERFNEDSPTRLTGYCYADDKYEVDVLLQEMYETQTSNKAVMVIKPSTITGPHGRLRVGKFSLAAALSSDANKSGIPFFIRWMLMFTPIVGRWTRQFVHEDDIVDVVSIGACGPRVPGIRTYIVSPSDVVVGKEMARMTNKVGVWIPGWATQAVFFFAWHLTRGRVPTAPHTWKYFAYPICVDGSRLVRELGHNYRYTSVQAISELAGRYTPCSTST